ncbi:Pr6Pr family membrane protein [Pedobacter nanyangensis]|uniref:Pr6Pr family membrane protein n=1 Tax=Pedobacter nanyangensis TaxID=1562389 RepID=UPI000DE52A28|nr:Pr6Pr family membrane protein [Pedobacter nanyangensis]
MKQTEKIYLGLLTVTTWFALVFQFYLHINSGVATGGELLVRFFSYFTIDSNLLVALCATAILLMPQTALGRFFKKPSVITAITVYIAVVALVYNAVLRFLWVLNGWAIVLNELLHVIVPILFLTYWIYFVPKYQLKWANIWGWLVFPLIYILFVLTRGNYADFYPYPFLNVSKLGLQQVIFNCMLITLLLLILFLGFIAIGKRQIKRQSGQ